MSSSRSGASTRPSRVARPSTTPGRRWSGGMAAACPVSSPAMTSASSWVAVNVLQALASSGPASIDIARSTRPASGLVVSLTSAMTVLPRPRSVTAVATVSRLWPVWLAISTSVPGGSASAPKSPSSPASTSPTCRPAARSTGSAIEIAASEAPMPVRITGASGRAPARTAVTAARRSSHEVSSRPSTSPWARMSASKRVVTPSSVPMLPGQAWPGSGSGRLDTRLTPARTQCRAGRA